MSLTSWRVLGMAAEQPLLLTEPGFPPVHPALQMQSGLVPNATGQNLRYSGGNSSIIKIACKKLLKMCSHPTLEGRGSSGGDADFAHPFVPRKSWADVGSVSGSSEAGLQRQYMQSQEGFAAQQGQQQQQQQQQLSRPSGSMASAAANQQQLSLAHPVPTGQSAVDLEAMLSEAHSAYRTGDFTRALQLCQSVRALS